MPGQKRKRSSPTTGELPKPSGQTFLSSLSMEEAINWRTEILKARDLSHLINGRHLSPNLTITQLKSLTSIGTYDGMKNQFVSSIVHDVDRFRTVFYKLDGMRNRNKTSPQAANSSSIVNSIEGELTMVSD
jgi:hypothetical protein